jgi:putative endonuclease
MPQYFYVARCNDGSLYVGSCHSLKEREGRHNDGKGAKYTRDRRPIMIIYSEQFSTLLEARKRELQVKKWSRVKKENLVAGKHPTKSPHSLDLQKIHLQ